MRRQVPEYPGIQKAIPSVIQQSIPAISTTFLTALVSTYSVTAIAAYGVTGKLETNLFYPAMVLNMVLTNVLFQFRDFRIESVLLFGVLLPCNSSSRLKRSYGVVIFSFLVAVPPEMKML